MAYSFRSLRSGDGEKRRSQTRHTYVRDFQLRGEMYDLLGFDREHIDIEIEQS
jgi:hypothetical protein